MGARNLTTFLLVILLMVNALFIGTYLSKSNYKIIETENSIIEASQSVIEPPSNEIKISLHLMDVYRLDTSCDFITRDLGQQLSVKYKNSKKCSYSSLNPKLNEMIKNTLNNTIKLVDKYVPILDSTGIEFDPFNNGVNYLDPNSKFLQFNSLNLGGVWWPNLKEANKDCDLTDLDFVVFVVPFSQSRLDNLKLFLLNIHSYLQTQDNPFKYQIIVVEQENQNVLFNKGRLLNRAFKYVFDTHKDVDCVVIHDVDLIPATNGTTLKSKGDYRCRQMPWHLSNEVYLMSTKESRGYNPFLTGGILSLRPEHIKNANGFSNQYFGWGAEDDDWTLRMFSTDLCIMRPKDSVAVTPFVMLKHLSSAANTKRYELLSNAIKQKKLDGLSNIENLSEIKQIKFYIPFTHLLVDVKN